MNKAFEKILERLDDGVSLPKMNGMERRVGKRQTQGFGIGVLFAKEIVKEVAKEYKDSWISCSERLPEPNQKVIVTYMDRYIGGSYGVCEGQYVYILNSLDISDYMSDDDFEVLAWQPLPEPFKERD